MSDYHSKIFIIAPSTALKRTRPMNILNESLPTAGLDVFATWTQVTYITFTLLPVRSKSRAKHVWNFLYNLMISLFCVMPPLNMSAITLPLMIVSCMTPWACFGSTRPYQIPCPARG